MLITLNNCCTKSYLDSMMLLSQRSHKWNFRYPEGKPFEQRFAKINLVQIIKIHLLLVCHGFTLTNL